jgi:NTP pyrophosphatase (non-canonical NTP hydrolase)
MSEDNAQLLAADVQSLRDLIESQCGDCEFDGTTVCKGCPAGAYRAHIDSAHAHLPRKAQKQVYQAVEKRGYLDTATWEHNQLIVRQVVKLIEELGELTEHVSVKPEHTMTDPVLVLGRMRSLGAHARQSFTGAKFEEPGYFAKYLCEELTDLQVVIFTLSELLGFDVVQAAQEKATADVTRGVRG